MSNAGRRLGAWVKHVFSAAVIAGLLLYLWEHRNDIEAGFAVSAGQIAQLVVLILLTWVLSSLPMLIVTRLMGKRVGFWENLAVTLAGALANYLPLRIGTMIRMHFFKKAHGLDYSAFIGIMGVRTLLMLALTGLLGCIGLMGLSASGEALPVPVLVSFAVMGIFPLVLMSVPLQRFGDRDTRLGRISRQLSAGHTMLRANPAALGILMAIMAAQFLVLAIRFHIAFEVFGLAISPWALLLLGPVTTLVTFISITPGNLGVREWIIGGLADIAGQEFQLGVFAGTLDRAVLMVLTFLIGPICLYYTMRKSR